LPWLLRPARLYNGLNKAFSDLSVVISENVETDRLRFAFVVGLNLLMAIALSLLLYDIYLAFKEVYVFTILRKLYNCLFSIRTIPVIFAHPFKFTFYIHCIVSI